MNNVSVFGFFPIQWPKLFCLVVFISIHIPHCHMGKCCGHGISSDPNTYMGWYSMVYYLTGCEFNFSAPQWGWCFHQKPEFALWWCYVIHVDWFNSLVCSLFVCFLNHCLLLHVMIPFGKVGLKILFSSFCLWFNLMARGRSWNQMALESFQVVQEISQQRF